MRQKIEEMLTLQNQLEESINGELWREKEHDYLLCIYMEANEIVDHIGWKHWKAHPQVHDSVIQMELVDVWHFILAAILQRGASAELFIPDVERSIANAEHISEHINTIDIALNLALTALVEGKVALAHFFALCERYNMDFDLLYRFYIAKHTLNHFRQEHGYKDGTYKKHWGGREDNEHCLELVTILGDDFSAETLTQELFHCYRIYTGKL